MTAGEHLRRRQRAFLGVTYVGFGLFLAFTILPAALGAPNWGPWLPMIGLAGFGLAFVGFMLGHLIGFRCPFCRANLASLFLQGSGFGG